MLCISLHTKHMLHAKNAGSSTAIKYLKVWIPKYFPSHTACCQTLIPDQIIIPLIKKRFMSNSLLMPGILRCLSDSDNKQVPYLQHLPSQCFLIMDYSIVTLQKSFHVHLSKLATERRTHLERWYGWHWCAKLAVLCPSATSWHPAVASLTTAPILLQELGPHYSSVCLLLSREWFAVLPDSLLLRYLECQNIAATTNNHRVRICSPDQFWSNVDGEHRDP